MGQIKQRIEGGVTTAHYQHPTTGIALAMGSKHIGNTVEDVLVEKPFPSSWQAIGPQRIGRQVGAGGINHRTRQYVLLALIGALDAHNEGRLFPSQRLHLIHSLSAHGQHPCGEVKRCLHLRNGRQREQVLLNDLSSSWISIWVGWRPLLLL